LTPSLVLQEKIALEARMREIEEEEERAKVNEKVATIAFL
jgi:hypothetical protein